MHAQLEIPTILTPNLTLRPLQVSDAETLHRIYQTDGVLRYFPNPNPPPLEKSGVFLPASRRTGGSMGMAIGGSSRTASARSSAGPAYSSCPS